MQLKAMRAKYAQTELKTLRVQLSRRSHQRQIFFWKEVKEFNSISELFIE